MRAVKACLFKNVPTSAGPWFRQAGCREDSEDLDAMGGPLQEQSVTGR